MPKRKDLAVVSIGVLGLDEILRGGLPASNLYMLQGAPGSGKTTAALQFLRAGVKAGESCIYVTLSQTAKELEAMAVSHGWTLDGIRVEELTTSGTVSEADDQSIFLTADLRLDETRKAIEAAIEVHKPRRLVYDSLCSIKMVGSSFVISTQMKSPPVSLVKSSRMQSPRTKFVWSLSTV